MAISPLWRGAAQSVGHARIRETVKTEMLSRNETPIVLALFLPPVSIRNKPRLRENSGVSFLATKRRTQVTNVPVSPEETKRRISANFMPIVSPCRG